MTEKPEWALNLVREKSLFQVFSLSKGIFGARFNFCVTVFAVIVASIWFVPLRAQLESGTLSFSSARELFQSWTAIGASFAATILGFLIAGFTVFATVSNPSLFVALSKVDSDENPKESIFKMMMVNFVNCFVHYVSYFSFSILLQMGLMKHSFLLLLVKSRFFFENFNQSILIALALITYLIWTVVILLKLKSFIWNVYTNVVLFVGEALVGNDAIDQLTKFNQSLIDYAVQDSNPRAIDGIILTKFDTVDENVGTALNMVYTTGKPIIFVGVGQKYPHLKKLNV
jgi:hypothetical protein